MMDVISSTAMLVGIRKHVQQSISSFIIRQRSSRIKETRHGAHISYSHLMGCEVQMGTITIYVFHKATQWSNPDERLMEVV